jgi:hypothetical protein
LQLIFIQKFFTSANQHLWVILWDFSFTENYQFYTVLFSYIYRKVESQVRRRGLWKGREYIWN